MATDQPDRLSHHQPETLDRRRFLQGAAGVALATPLSALLSACQSGNQTSPSSTKGGTLVYAMEISDLPPLDPGTALSQGSTLAQAIQPMFEGLTMYDRHRSDVVPPPIPVLATSWKLLEDGKVWEWSLRKGVTFHDGTPWNADAAIWNFQRLYDPKSPQFYNEAAQLAVVYMPGPILALEKVDDMTFRMRLPVSRPLDEELEAHWMVSPTAVKAKGNDGFGVAPVGTGGMKFSNLVKGQQFEMVPYDKYWGPAYKLDKVIVRPIGDASARVNALISGEIDLGVELPPDGLAPLRNAGKNVMTSVRPHTWEFLFNTQMPPFNDKRVRQALNYAIDRKSMADNILKGTAIPMTQLAIPGSDWYDSTLQPYTYDPEKARSLLAQANLPNGFTTDWLTATNGSGELQPVPMSEFIQSALRDIKVNVNLKTYEWTAYLGIFFKGMPPGVGAMQISYGWSWTYWWGQLFSTEYLPPKAVLNPGRYTNPAIDPIYAQALSTSDTGKRASLVKQIQRIVWDDAPWLFCVHGLNVRALSPKVQGFINAKEWQFQFQTIHKT
jgi:peptide/nickel transport system substrate-binding protein